MGEVKKSSLSDYGRGSAAYGGDGWRGRETRHVDEIGTLWGGCGIDSEWRRLRRVVLHRPGKEVVVDDHQADASLFLDSLDLARAQAEHDELREAYVSAGVTVVDVEPPEPVSPNQMFCADLFAMTPQGAVLARPASAARAGEEVHVAKALATSHVPILKVLTGQAVFEGADLMWLDERTALIGRGHRTNQAAIEQITHQLSEIGCSAIVVDMPYGTMHLMGTVRIPAKDLAICWHRRTPHAAVVALQERGFDVQFIPEGEHARELYRAMNFVTLDDRKILMVRGVPQAQAFLESLHVECLTSPTDELAKAAGNMGCLTGVLERNLAFN